MPASPCRLARGRRFSSAVMSKPSGGIRSLPSLSAWGLPTPVVALACICDVDIRVFSGAGCQLYFYGVCKFICLSSFMYNRFHKELRFFFSLLKRKKEAKKEKSSHSTCTVRFQYHPKITQETVTIDSHQQNSPGGANRRLVRRNTTLFTVEIGA